MSQTGVFLVDPSGLYRQDVTLALERIGCSVVASVGSIEKARNIIFNCRWFSPEARILIINGDVSSADDLLLEVLEAVKSIRNVIEHSSRPHRLGGAFVKQTDTPAESIKALCETVKTLV